MKQRSALPALSSPPPIAVLARALLDGSGFVVDTARLDIDRSLLDNAADLLAKLGMLRQLCWGSDHNARIVSGVVDLAESFDVSSASAIGVSGVLTDLLRNPDECDLAHALADAHRLLDDEDLAAGAAALSAAVTSYLADMLGEDPLTVHDELQRMRQPIAAHTQGSESVSCLSTRYHARTRTSAAGRRARHIPTCWG